MRKGQRAGDHKGHFFLNIFLTYGIPIKKSAYVKMTVKIFVPAHGIIISRYKQNDGVERELWVIDAERRLTHRYIDIDQKCYALTSNENEGRSKAENHSC